MPIIVRNEQPNFIKPTPGMHDAICVFVVDIGTHLEKTQWGPKEQHKVVFCWEIDETIPEGEYAGKPFMVSQRYTFTLFEKGNLSKILESWFSKKLSDETRKNGFDLEKLVGRKCTLNLIESDDGKYINVAQVLPPNTANKMVQVCNTKPLWIQKLIDTSIEKQKEAQSFDQSVPSDQQQGNEDNLPF